jgi:chorismate mutase
VNSSNRGVGYSFNSHGENILADILQFRHPPPADDGEVPIDTGRIGDFGEALAGCIAHTGEIARVTVAGQTWIHLEELESLRAEKASAIAKIDWLDGEITRLRAELGQLKDQVAQLKVENKNLKAAVSIAEDKIERLMGMLNQQRRDSAKFLQAYDTLSTSAGKLSIALREALEHMRDDEPGRQAADRTRAILAAGE